MAEDNNKKHSPSDFGTPELQEKLKTTVEMSSENKRRTRVLIQIPIDYYKHLSKGGINYRQWEAGNRLYSDFEAASYLPSHVPVLSSVYVPANGFAKERTPSQYAARERFVRALDVVGKPESSGVLIVRNVCCYEKYLKDLNIPYYSTANAMMARLCEALDALADYYKIPYYPVETKTIPTKRRKSGL